MRYISFSSLLLPFSILFPSFVFGASGIAVPDVALGYNLQKAVALMLAEPAPDEGVDIVLKSSQPGLLRISNAPDRPGTASVVIRVRQGYRESPEFWLQALGSEGAVSYTASAPKLSGTGT